MILVTLVMIVVTSLVLYRLRRRRMYELAARIPGPAEWPLVGHLFQFKGNTEEIMTSLKGFSYDAMKHGGISKLWLGNIIYFVLVNPVDIEYVLKACLEKDDLHRFIRTVVGNGIVFAPVLIWRRRRKVIVPAFTPKLIESFVEVFSEQSEELVTQLQDRVGSGTFDAWPFFSSYTLDSVCETVMGIKLKAQSNNDGEFLMALNRMLNLICERIFHLWLHPEWLYKWMPSYKEHLVTCDILHSFTDNVISYKKEEIKREQANEPEADHENRDISTNRKTFLSMLISLSSKDQCYTNLELREEVLSLTVAGTDTSAVGTCFTLLLLGKHQDVQERVYQELLDIYGKSQRPLVKEDLSKLCYLEQVIKESLRLYPPVPFIIRKVQKEITLPSGHILPAGCGVPVSIWGTHRNPKYWGADAEQFLPERFSAERISTIHPYAYLPFSAGPRNCLGYQYAMMSIKTSVSRVLRKYRELVSAESLAEPDIRVKIYVLLQATSYQYAMMSIKTSVSRVLRKYRVLVSAESLAEPEIRVKIDVMMKAADGYNILVEPRQ